MRNVYCKVDDVSEAKTCCKALYTKFVKLGLNPEIDVAGIPESSDGGEDSGNETGVGADLASQGRVDGAWPGVLLCGAPEAHAHRIG